MKIYCVIPAYNEQEHIENTIQSILAQTIIPTKIVIVNDNSTDNTLKIAENLEKIHPQISVINHQSTQKHLPGSKVIHAFYAGYNSLDKDYDLIVKLDADLILPNNYFEKVIETYEKDPKIGMVGGHAYIKVNNKWVIESLTDKDHIRGAFKCYRKECFMQIGGLKTAMGWDTVDELLCYYYNWKVITIPELKVKHLKPTASTYHKKAKYKQGEAFYSLGYGICLTTIAAAKLALKKKKPTLFIDYIIGYYKAKQNKVKPLVSKEQAKFVRKYRWNKIIQKILKK